MNELVTVNQVPGYFNYVSKPGQRGNFQLAQLEEVEEAVFYPVLENTYLKNYCSNCGRKLENGLPLVSDLGEINTPYDLIYARLEGLQYA